MFAQILKAQMVIILSNLLIVTFYVLIFSPLLEHLEIQSLFLESYLLEVHLFGSR
jgi:hypothetical protein